MRTLEFQVEVGQDGKLRVEVATDLPPGPVEGVILVQSAKRPQTPPYDTLEGAFAGQLPDIDVNNDVREISTAWKRDVRLSPMNVWISPSQRG